LLAEIEELNPISPTVARLQPEILTSLGQWLNHLKSEPTPVVFSEYLNKALQLLQDGPGNLEACEKAHLTMATLADQQYKHNLEYMTSTEFEERKANVEIRKKQVLILKEGVSKGDTALRNAAVIQERFLTMDITEIDRCSSQKEEFLMTSVENYLQVLRCGKLSLPFYRILSMWFENEESEKLNQLLDRQLALIPSHKIAALLYQMAARMSLPEKNKSSFSSILFSCIKRITVDHPHHGLPIVLALKNAAQDEILAGRNPPKDAGMDLKSKAASQLVKELEGQKDLCSIVQKYRALSSAMIRVAYIKPPQKHAAKAVTIPGTEPYVKIKDWSDIPPPTDTLPVRPDRNYAGYAGIARFEPTYQLVGGVNAPKKTVCWGTDGMARDQLIKGQDDLRQDAVMQQVFRLMNQLLREESGKTRQDALQVRTYRIMPLSQRSGVLEWCRNTRPIADILVGSQRQSGVHAKYFPRQLSWQDCRQSYVDHTSKKTAQENFMNILNNFSPAMKFFFLETFPSPGEYHTSRTAYTKSVATTSMVGHILGTMVG
jgi:ataxia telangiectasia mutated family protein